MRLQSSIHSLSRWWERITKKCRNLCEHLSHLRKARDIIWLASWLKKGVGLKRASILQSTTGPSIWSQPPNHQTSTG
jgi:hypothetical protein